jgi:hypothetical protein
VDGPVRQDAFRGWHTLTMTEIVKRLSPKLSTVRHLFAHSGNVCAFDPCDHPLIDAHGNFVAELCHIEAAELGGERFNPRMTNGERRQPENLMLMCHRHHVETNDLARFPVAVLRGIKAAHESQYAAAKLPVTEKQFEDAAEQIAESSIIDVTKRTVIKLPQTLAAYKLPPDELEYTLELLNPCLERLRRLPLDSRGVLLVVVERGEHYGDDLGLPVHELELVTGVKVAVLRRHLDLLDRYRIIHLDQDDDERTWAMTNAPEGWPFWRGLREHCEAAGLELETFIIELRFDLLDEVL